MLNEVSAVSASNLLPPLSSLKPFVCTAELGTTTSAATKLARSHGAVCRQIKTLEGWLGITLFERRNGRLILTEAGRSYKDSVSRAMSLLERASMDIRNHNEAGPIKVSCSSTFAKRWLLPRLVSFLERNPFIDLQLTRYIEGSHLPATDFDLAILMEPVSGHHLEIDPLMSDFLVPVQASERIVKDRSQARALIRTRDSLAGWEQWLKQEEKAAALRFLDIEDVDVAIAAAVLGRGAMIARGHLVVAELESGALEMDGDVALQVDTAYWLAMPKTGTRNKAVRALRSYLISEALVAVDKLKRRMPMLIERDLRGRRAG